MHEHPAPPPTGTEPTRLVFVVDGTSVGGAERALLSLLQGLDRSRYRVALFSTGAEGALLPAFRGACDRLESHPKRFAFDAALVGRLARLLREEQPHACVSVLFYADVVAGLAARRVPVPHVSWQHMLPSRDLKNRRLHHRLAYRLVLPRCARIVCCADCVREDLTALFPLDPTRLVTVHNGVDVQRFAFHEPRPHDGSFRVGMMARFDPHQKDQATLLHALERLRDVVPEARAVLAGDGPTRPAMQALAGQLGLAEHVEFPGNRSDLEGVIPDFDVVVLSSRYEAHPVSLLEAMACGRAVVASDLPGVREAVTPGEEALLFPAGDAAALAEALAGLARDPERRAALGRAGRAHVERDFEQHAQHAKLLAELQGLLENRTSSS